MAMPRESMPFGVGRVATQLRAGQKGAGRRRECVVEEPKDVGLRLARGT